MSTCITGFPHATSGDPDSSCGGKAAPCTHDHAIPFVDSPTAHQMRLRDWGGEDFFRAIAAARGNAEHDARISLESDEATGRSEIELFTFNDDEYAGIFMDDGDIVMLARSLFEIAVDFGSFSVYADQNIELEAATGGTGKHLLREGQGVVIPILAADPAGGDSEAGQLYYNSVDNVIRWYNGTAWADVGSGGVDQFDVVSGDYRFPTGFDTIESEDGTSYFYAPSGYVEIGVQGGGSLYYNPGEGWVFGSAEGVVLPWIAADPAGGASQAGQVYWNTTDGKFRWYDGTVWADLGATGPEGPEGPEGPAGDTGPQGDPGVGVPAGGTTGQLLAKVDSDDYDTEWVDPPSDGGGGFVPTYIGPSDTFTVPAERQALFAMAIDVAGILAVDGFLIEVS